MNFDEMHAAVKDAENTLRLADLHVSKMANLVAGRLRSGDVSGRVLAELKRELANYNIHTGKWKS